MKTMMKILFFITLISFGPGWTAEAKNKYKPHFMDCPFGLKIQPIGDKLQLVARAGTLGVVKINNIEEANSAVEKVSGLKYVSNVITLGRTSRTDKDDARGSRTIALLPYKGNYLWFFESEDTYSRYFTCYECKVTKCSDNTYNIQRISWTDLETSDEGEKDRAPNYRNVAIYDNIVYVTYRDISSFSPDLGLKRYVLNDDDGSPYFNHNGNSASRITDIPQLPKISLYSPSSPGGVFADTLLAMIVRPKGKKLELITVWTQYQEKGVILAAYDDLRNNARPTAISSHMTGYKSSYYSADIFPYPLRDRCSAGNEYTVLISADNKIWAYTVLNEDGTTSFEGGDDKDQIASKVKPDLSEICAVLETTSNSASTQNAPNLSVSILVYGVKFDNHNNDPDNLEDNYYRLSKDNLKLRVGYLVAPAKPSNLVSNTKKVQGSLNVNHGVGVVPIGIIYPPPFILPKDLVEPLDAPVGGYAKTSELLDDPQLMDLLNDNRAYENFVQAYNGACPGKDPVRFKWLFTSNGQSFLDGIAPVFVLEPTGEALKVNARSELDLGGSFPESLLAVKYKNEIEKGTLDTTLSEKITYDYKGEYGHINNNAIFVYWEYPESSILMYDVELYSWIDAQQYTNPLKFKVLAYNDKPGLKQLPFNSKNPDVNNVLLSGIKPVPQSYEVLKSDGTLAQSDYPYLSDWALKVYNWSEGAFSGDDPYLLNTYVRMTSEYTPKLDVTWSSTNFKHKCGDDNASTYTGGVSGILPDLDKIFKSSDGVNYGYTATQYKFTSDDTELGFTVPAQIELTSAVGTKDSPEGGKLTFDSNLKYRYYMIVENSPKAHLYNWSKADDWWVADIWRKKGIAPWVLYYSANLKDSDPRD